MTLSFLFWILMLFWAFFGIFPTFPRNTVAGQQVNYFPFGGSLLLFVLICLLGYHAFGWPIHP